MKFSYAWLQDYIPSLPPAKKVAELLLTHAFEVERVEKVTDDVVLFIDVLPNRIADASGHRGVAGELGALLKKPIKFPKRLRKETRESTSKAIQIIVKDKRGCPRYTARVLKNVTVSPSPDWLSKRLQACGINSINTIVDAANYIMLDMVQPLHVFDADKVEGSIIVRRAVEREKFIALDDKTYMLTAEDLVIADERGPLALAGIKGGKRAEVNAYTKHIIVESANFDPESIERTAKRVNLLTDAAVRFRVGIDPNLTTEALNEVVSLMQELAGGELLRGILDTGKRVPQRTVFLRPEKACSVLGFDMSQRDMADILKRLGFRVIKKGAMLKVQVPSLRVDVVVEEDLIEELARIYGFERIKPALPIMALTDMGNTGKEKFRRRVSERITSLGYTELYSYVFARDKEIDLFSEKKNLLKLLNPLRPDMAYLHPSLLGSLLSAFTKNQESDEVRAFEIGAVFHVPAAKVRDTTDLEEERIAFGFLSKNKKDVPFFELKGIVSSLLESFGIDDFYFDNVPDVTNINSEKRGQIIFHPYRSAEIKTESAVLGIIGEVHPRVLEAFGIKSVAGVVELSFAKLYEAVASERRYKEISKYPAIIRDIALLVPLDTRVVEVEDVIENTGGELLQKTDLIDLYEGAELPDGKKNFAFRLVFQSFDRTLTDEEVHVIVEKITKTLEAENPEWEVRK